MKLRSLNETGISQAGAFLDSLTTPLPEPYPSKLLTDTDSSAQLPVEIEIDPQVRFDRRYEAAAYLYRKLEMLRTPKHLQLERDRGVWAWLALLWFEQLCPPDRDGRYFPQERSRWVPLLDDPRRYYRHLLLGPYLMYKLHSATPKIVEPLLCGPMHVATGEAFRTIVETQQFLTSAPVVAVVGALYYDEVAGRLIRGAGVKGAGGVRRLGDVLSQLDLTYDLHSISIEDLLSLLPAEFFAVKQRARKGSESPRTAKHDAQRLGAQ